MRSKHSSYYSFLLILIQPHFIHIFCLSLYSPSSSVHMDSMFHFISFAFIATVHLIRFHYHRPSHSLPLPSFISHSVSFFAFFFRFLSFHALKSSNERQYLTFYCTKKRHTELKILIKNPTKTILCQQKKYDVENIDAALLEKKAKKISQKLLLHQGNFTPTT